MRDFPSTYSSEPIIETNTGAKESIHLKSALATYEKEILSRARLHKKYNDILFYFTATFISLVVINFSVQETRVCLSNSFAPAGVQLDYFIVGLFYFIGLEFLTVGIAMTLTTRKYYPQFYKDYGGSLIAATIILSLPMFLRSLDTQLFRNNIRY